MSKYAWWVKTNIQVNSKLGWGLDKSAQFKWGLYILPRASGHPGMIFSQLQPGTQKSVKYVDINKKEPFSGSCPSIFSQLFL